VVRHRGSNTLNFDFHPPQTCGTAERGRVTPGSSAPPSPMPGPGATTPACPRPPGWSATWTKDSKRRERRWVKYDGIGPVDETGMPIASRSSVDQPRDWYRSMFRQIHRKLPGESRCHGTARRGTTPPHPPPPSPQSRTGTPTAAPRVNSGWPWGGGLGAPPPPPTQVLLERELEQLSQELDEDMRAMETRRRPGQVPPSIPPPRHPWAGWPQRDTWDWGCGHPAVWASSCVGIQLCAQPPGKA
uniref:SoHo domain-containing protein n=1 Tax=Strix occidentalis caurina TaxID=311401 RepID=A0A8D0EW36_STROC